MPFSAINWFLQLLFPDYCIVCSKRSDLLCEVCRKGLTRSLPQCYICRRLSDQFITHKSCSSTYYYWDVTILWQYNKVAKKLIKAYKYNGIKRVSDLINRCIDYELDHRPRFRLNSSALLIPVPLHFMKSNKRGFNQLDLIGTHLAQRYGASYIPDFLARKVNSRKQSGLSNIQRHSNVKGIFTLSEKYRKALAKASEIVIIDDIVTSGASLEECARAILAIAPHVRLRAVALFRGNPPRPHPQPPPYEAYAKEGGGTEGV